MIKLLKNGIIMRPYSTNILQSRYNMFYCTVNCPLFCVFGNGVFQLHDRNQISM
jgi:hypothetical protein